MGIGGYGCQILKYEIVTDMVVWYPRLDVLGRLAFRSNHQTTFLMRLFRQFFSRFPDFINGELGGQVNWRCFVCQAFNDRWERI